MKSYPLKAVSSQFVSRPHYNTVRKWVRKGVWCDTLRKHVVLESFTEGRRIFVSQEAIDRFIKETSIGNA